MLDMLMETALVKTPLGETFPAFEHTYVSMKGRGSDRGGATKKQGVMKLHPFVRTRARAPHGHCRRRCCCETNHTSTRSRSPIVVCQTTASERWFDGFGVVVAVWSSVCVRVCVWGGRGADKMRCPAIYL